MLNETWSSGHDGFHLDNFTFYDFPRPYKHPDALRYSGGIGIFIRNDVKGGITIHKSYRDNIVWLKLCKIGLGLERDVYLCSIYFPPANSTWVEDDLFITLYDHISSIKESDGILIIGDTNARTSNLNELPVVTDGRDPDIISNNEEYFEDLDISFIDRLRKNNVFERKSLDFGNLNAFGTELINLCRASRLIICNGRLHADAEVGNYTRSDTTGNSVVDYAIASLHVYKMITNFSISNKFPESDHLPISISLKTNQVFAPDALKSKEVGTSNWYSTYKYIWTKKDIHQISSVLEDTISKNYRNVFIDSVCQLNKVENVSRAFNNYMTQAFDRIFEKRRVKDKCRPRGPAWFDNECKRMRNQALQAGKNMQYDDNNASANTACREYRRIKQYKKERITMLV